MGQFRHERGILGAGDGDFGLRLEIAHLLLERLFGGGVRLRFLLKQVGADQAFDGVKREGLLVFTFDDLDQPIRALTVLAGTAMGGETCPGWVFLIGVITAVREDGIGSNVTHCGTSPSWVFLSSECTTWLSNVCPPWIALARDCASA